jgi:hypothetical protein
MAWKATTNTRSGHPSPNKRQAERIPDFVKSGILPDEGGLIAHAHPCRSMG